MISSAYIQNVLDKSEIIIDKINDQCLMGIMLPNTFVMNIVGRDERDCYSLAKCRIGELESYLEKDKKYYNYDLEEEFISE